MWMMVSAIAAASLLGSMHCVGMCGPLAIWSCGGTENHSRKKLWLLGSLYHGGRLVTYVVAGAVAGMVGSVVDWGGEAVGIQLAAARAVGGIMIFLGVLQLLSQLGILQRRKVGTSTTGVGRVLAYLRPRVVRLPFSGRALLTGMLTTLLPCGWLYLFAMFAAGSGSVQRAVLIMAAFWVGTLPALIGVVAGTRLLSIRFQYAVPAVAAVLMIFTGCYTASGRGFNDLDSLIGIEQQAKQADASDLTNATLPCCRHHKK